MVQKIVIFLLILISGLTNADETIVLAIGDWEPYTSSRDHNGKIAEKIVREAFELEEISVVYEYFPWKRCGFNVKNGQHTATFPWMKTKEREEDFLFNSIPVITTKTVFFHLKELDFDWNDIVDLRSYKIGGTIGYATADLLEENGLDLILSRNDDINYKNILSGIIELFPVSMHVGYYQIKMLFGTIEASLFTHHPKPVVEEVPMFMLFSKDNPNASNLAAKLDLGLTKLKESGRYNEIINELINN